MKKVLCLALLSAMIISGCKTDQIPEVSYSRNPVLPGSFADPCVVVYRDTFYVYATSGREATVWRSADFRNWKLTELNWPTSMKLPSVWAPAVREGNDGRFYLYTSTDHNLYAGVADHPLGPFENILGGDSIFIKNRQWWDKMHTIDADCFIDDDGQVYLYWGSGFDFKDGICAVGILDDDMASFREQPRLITPENYFEGPHMLKKEDLYYLMYSDGYFFDSTYKVRYAISEKPTGPFVEGKNSPILISTPDGVTIGPAHHYTMTMGGKSYIIYHKHAYPPGAEGRRLIRQVCIDRLEFETDGSIEKVVATDEGVPLDFVPMAENRHLLFPESVEASGYLGEYYTADKAFDDDFGTLWAVDNGSEPAWLEASFGKTVNIGSVEPVFDRIMDFYSYRIEYLDKKGEWRLYGEGNNRESEEWPVELKKEVKAKKIRITIDPVERYKRLGLWEFNIYSKK